MVAVTTNITAAIAMMTEVSGPPILTVAPYCPDH